MHSGVGPYALGVEFRPREQRAHWARRHRWLALPSAWRRVRTLLLTGGNCLRWFRPGPADRHTPPTGRHYRPARRRGRPEGV